jgi:hypothetical protein
MPGNEGADIVGGEGLTRGRCPLIQIQDSDGHDQPPDSISLEPTTKFVRQWGSDKEITRVLQ